MCFQCVKDNETSTGFGTERRIFDRKITKKKNKKVILSIYKTLEVENCQPS